MISNDTLPTLESQQRLEAKVDRLAADLALLVRHQQRQSELIDEATPIVRLAMNGATEKLQALEERGALGFARGSMRLLDTLVSAYGEDDIDELGRQLVTILDTVRALTQPAVLSVANQATEVLHHPEKVQPLGVLGLARASNDEDVQRGMAMFIEVLRHLGQATKGLQEQREASRRYQRRDAPAPGPEPVRRVRHAPAAPAARESARPAAPAAAPSAGLALDEGGFLVDRSLWSREFAAATALGLGVGELGPRHWQVIDFARQEFAETGASPNIRRLAMGSGVETREIYDLFKKAPGKTVAKIAGTPKPVGCI